MADNVPITPGSGATIATEDVGGAHFQKVITDNEAHALFRGRIMSFRTPGRAGTAGQKLLALFNGSGSGRVLTVNTVTVDLYQTVVKAITVAPPIVRVSRMAAAPTNGTTLTKVAKDSDLSSAAQVVATGDASADGTGSGTTLTHTVGAGTLLAQEFAPRFITGAGYEPADRMVFLEDAGIVLREGQGLLVHLDYTLATQNPTTDMWIAGIDWLEV